MKVEEVSELPLPGLDGSNPLAFLAALGVLKASAILFGSESALSWSSSSLSPTLRVPRGSVNLWRFCCESAQLLHDVAHDDLSAKTYESDVIKINRATFRTFAGAGAARVSKSASDRSALQSAFAAAFGCDGIGDKSEDEVIAISAFSYANGQGGKKLLDGFRQLAKLYRAAENKDEAPSADGGNQEKKPSLQTLICEALTSWRRRPDYPSFRWEPVELRRYAYMANKPEHEPLKFVAGANALGVLGLTMLSSFPFERQLETICISAKPQSCFLWPLWESFLSVDTTTSLLAQRGERNREVAPGWSTHLGVFARYGCERVSKDKSLYFSPSSAV